MSFAVVMEGMTLIVFIVTIVGGKQKRERGWKVLSGLLVFVGLIQCASMSIIVSVLLRWAAILRWSTELTILRHLGLFVRQ